MNTRNILLFALCALLLALCPSLFAAEAAQPADKLYIREVVEKHASRVVLLSWTREAPTLLEWLRALMNGAAQGARRAAGEFR